ncbi:Fur family transcriptional regulator [Aestuariispira insulae]|uniref:Fur family zinc uptake transcriptional regulator n=1 Tax=Aestuariispira insulae TaxID=1461337 RepID=A0A3D9H8K6_9PROT|nr:Fur family transcriptional regulator [Aestuariispira insulae]RED45815.1 Fur family zinc uptake transcriptional regulator [Aestuariispira insulae]
MADHNHELPEMTKNQALVYGALNSAQAPLSAYTILDQLREEGFRAPLQVYRALDKLVEFGVVHKLESLNAFVACAHPDCYSHETVAFTICEKCGQVAEVNDDKLGGRLEKIAAAGDFALRRSIIELRGICAVCRG